MSFERLTQKVNTIVTLPSAEMQYFLSRVEHKQAGKGQHLIKEGDTCDFIAYVDGGILRTYLNVDGSEINTEFFQEGSFAGAFTSFLLNAKTSLNIQALEDASLIYISKTLLTELYQRNPLWMALGKHIFEQEFIKKCTRESSLLQESAKQRYLALLKDFPQIEGRVPLFHIASYLGIKSESLSRIRSGTL
jgi:CRP-like cAMP-binding protein